MKEFNYKKALWITAGVLTALIVVRAVLFFTAKPKVTVDYVAEYNRFSLPDNYNPEDNAAELYQKAFDAFVEMPETLVPLQYRAELTAEEKEQLKNWLDSNAQAFEYFRQASEKPYYWIERFSKTTPPILDEVLLPELSIMRSFLTAYIRDSECKADAGQFMAAFESLLTCYRAGIQKCRPNQFAMDQHMGYRCRHDVLQTAFDFLDQYLIEKKTLESLQTALVSFIENDKSPCSVRAGKLFVLDLIQQTFVYNKEGHGRWAWRNRMNSSIDLSDIFHWSDNYDILKQRLHLCLIAPTQREVAQKLDELTDLSEKMMLMTPWEVQNAPFDYRKRIQQIKTYHTVLHWADSGTYLWKSSHETKARTRALIAVLAVLRFRQDSGRYPQSLQEMVDKSYLQTLPMDPYSDGPLVYRVTEDGFTLYSVGDDFTDNNGTAESDRTFSTPSKAVVEINHPDIVYWPVYHKEDFPAQLVDPNDSTLNGMMPYGLF